MTKTYCLSNIDPELWKKFKTACAYFDVSIRATFINRINFMISEQEGAIKMHDKPKAYTKKRGNK